MRPASQVSPTMAATVKTSATPTCQAGTSPPDIRTAMRIGANGGSSEATATAGGGGVGGGGVGERGRADREDGHRRDRALDLLRARDQGRQRRIAGGVEEEA